LVITRFAPLAAIVHALSPLADTRSIAIASMGNMLGVKCEWGTR
jgi:hypothetical protein